VCRGAGASASGDNVGGESPPWTPRLGKPGSTIAEVEMTTGKKDASKASKLLSNPKTPKSVKSVAASDLAQAKKKGKAK
jgi:hypothetical protein